LDKKDQPKLTLYGAMVLLQKTGYLDVELDTYEKYLKLKEDIEVLDLSDADIVDVKGRMRKLTEEIQTKKQLFDRASRILMELRTQDERNVIQGVEKMMKRLEDLRSYEKLAGELSVLENKLQSAEVIRSPDSVIRERLL
jgi:hypothetical protein